MSWKGASPWEGLVVQLEAVHPYQANDSFCLKIGGKQSSMNVMSFDVMFTLWWVSSHRHFSGPRLWKALRIILVENYFHRRRDGHWSVWILGWWYCSEDPGQFQSRGRSHWDAAEVDGDCWWRKPSGRQFRKLGDKGLDLMAEYQDHFTDEWTALVTPLHLAASGDFVETQVNSFVRNALEVYRKHGPVVWMFGMFSLCIFMWVLMSISFRKVCTVVFSWGVAEHDLQRTLPCALQQTVMKAIKGCLDEIVSQKVASPQFVEIHKNIICDGCGSVSIKEFSPYW